MDFKDWVYIVLGLTLFALVLTVGGEVMSDSLELRERVCAAAAADNKSLDDVEWNCGFTDAELEVFRSSNPLFCDVLQPNIDCTGNVTIIG